MKQQRMRFRLLTLVIIGLLGIAGVYGFYSVSTYGSRWFSSSKNTRYQSAKQSVIKGDIIDRKGVIRHVQVVSEITNEPDYAAALEAARAAMK